jgi:lysine 2,3-aminomutase
MERWQEQIEESITTLEQLKAHLPVDIEPLKAVVDRFPLRVSPYYLNLVKEPGDPIGRQCIPDPAELAEDRLMIDPLNEEGFSPVPGLIHRYPDRVVFIVSSGCATFCRFCMRKHRCGKKDGANLGGPGDEAFGYIEKTKTIRDVILSGGDPLFLTDDILKKLLKRIRTIRHVEIIRINTRAPVTLPERITSGLCSALRYLHPLYINTHFNHPSEITPQSSEACSRLADTGIPLGNQTVLLKGVNDDPEVMKRLMQKLLLMRVRPYYIHQMDLVKGTGHFRTSVRRGLEIMRSLRGHTSGLAVPHYMIDLPGGKGKVSLQPEDVRFSDGVFYIRNYRGEMIEYRDVEEPRERGYGEE